MKELEILLDNYWISKDEEKELYYRVKDGISDFKGFLTDKLGYHLIINPYLIKLEKLPGCAEEWMGIEEFESTMEYGFLCILLIFLEDRGREEQFVLSQITEFIQANYPGDEKVDWTLFKHRKCLIRVMRFAAKIGLLRLNDGDEGKFANDLEQEILYESTGLSRYFVRSFSQNILGYTSYRDIEDAEIIEIDKDRGILRRQRVYRRLVMSPIVYNEGAEDSDYAYIRNYRGMMENDFEKYLGLPLHVHRNGALLAVPEGRSLRDCFPELRAISDIVLQMNDLIYKYVKNGKLPLSKDDIITISRAAFEAMINELREKCSMGWSKEYREIGLDGLIKEIIKYMSSFNMLANDENLREIKIMPLTGKVTGHYPDDFTGDEGMKEAAADGN